MSIEHVEFLVEEPSMEAFLRALLPKLLHEIEFQIYPSQCNQELLKRLPERLRGYSSWLPESWRIVVVVDRDDEDCYELKQHLDDVEYCINKDLEFHQILVQATHNRVFESMLAPLAELLKQSRMETLHISGVQKAIDEHSQILNALRRKDPELSEACMRRHLATAEEIIRESVEPKQ